MALSRIFVSTRILSGVTTGRDTSSRVSRLPHAERDAEGSYQAMRRVRAPMDLIRQEALQEMERVRREGSPPVPGSTSGLRSRVIATATFAVLSLECGRSERETDRSSLFSIRGRTRRAPRVLFPGGVGVAGPDASGGVEMVRGVPGLKGFAGWRFGVTAEAHGGLVGADAVTVAWREVDKVAGFEPGLPDAASHIQPPPCRMGS